MSDENQPAGHRQDGWFSQPANLRRGRAISLFASLLIFWLILAGSLDVQRIAVGILVAGLLTIFWGRKLLAGPAEVDMPAIRIFLHPAFPLYVWRLVVEIVKANLIVARIVLQPKMPISPHFVIVKTELKHDLSRVVYANSITLTPGTISVSLTGDTLVVHALTKEAAEGVPGWDIEKRVQRLETAWKE